MRKIYKLSHIVARTIIMRLIEGRDWAGGTRGRRDFGECPLVGSKEVWPSHLGSSKGRVSAGGKQARRTVLLISDIHTVIQDSRKIAVMK